MKHRLNDVGLGHLAIDLHGADLSSKKVMQQVACTLDVLRASVPVDCEKTHSQLVDRRDRLNAHVDRMHKRREPTNKSVYEMQGTLLRLAQVLASSTRWSGQELSRITTRVAQQIRDLLTEAGGLASLFLRTDPSPWTGAQLPDGDAVQRASDIVSKIADQSCPRFMASLHEVVNQTGLRWPASAQSAGQIAELLAAVQQTLSLYSEGLYSQDLASLLRNLAPGKAGGIAAVWTWCTNGSYRRARNLVLSLRSERKVPPQQLFSEVTETAIQLAKWRSVSAEHSMPRTPTNVSEHIQSFRNLTGDVASLSSILPSGHLSELSIDDLCTLIRSLVSDNRTPFQLPKLTQIEQGLEKAGAGRLVTEIKAKKIPEHLWPTMLDYAWFASTLDAVSRQDPEVPAFRGSTHGRYVEEFAGLDEQGIALAADRVRRAHGERAIAAMNDRPSQEQLIRGEAAKMKRHLPLRKVFSQAADVLTAVCPCWMASPLSVSQLLDGGHQYFDFVIFDEASQVLPEDAVPAVLRGRKVVVAGDSKQLPPTTFFAAGDADDYAADEEASATEGYESLLDVMIPFVHQSYLDWHYRSRDEALINFSNHHIYQDRLVTFPGPGGPPVVNHIVANQELGIDGQEESSTGEVQKVVSLILEHARNNPTQTLGVITMGIRHMNRLQAALDRQLENQHDLGAFFDPNVNERFFVKNLERVQGDERDAIIISIGYGKDRAGNLPLRFGPLLSEGGRRRLNVAVTRARQKLTVVSSFSHLDIDLARLRPGSGVELLRDYLLYASSNGKRLGDAEIIGVAVNDSEADVFDVLTSRGLKLIPQLGASHFRIDMVAVHPDNPGRFVLAIECDGASYHSSYTARDRDRLRQQQLENLGWRFHRIWSTDWFMRKEDDVKRALKAFHEAVEYANKLDRGVAPDEHDRNGNARPEEGAATTAQNRAARPPIPYYPSIMQYRLPELIALIRWINSDGQLRTDEQVISEMVATLGFRRRGVRIETAICSAISALRGESH